MNPHLHQHLYSDLPGYKLGRSSGILSRGFHCKLCVLQLLSQFPIFVLCVCACVYLGWQVESHGYLISECIGPLTLSEYDVSILAPETVWHVTRVLTLVPRDHVKEFFKQTDQHACESKPIPYINGRFDFRARLKKRPKQNIYNHS